MDYYGRWEDAMVTQTQLLQRAGTHAGAKFLHGFFEDQNTKYRDLVAHRDPKMLAAIQYQILRDAEPVYVSMDACELVDYARETFEPEPTLPGDAFVPSGFCLLPRPIMLRDAPWTPDQPGRSLTGKLPIRAIGWTSLHTEDLTAGSWWIAYYVDARDERDRLAEEGKLHLWGDEFDEIIRRLGPLTLMHQFQWQWGTNPWANADDHQIGQLYDEDPAETKARGKSQVALVQTLWRIGSQIIPVKQRAPRGFWKDANRRGIQARDVTVVTLRRGREYEDVEPTGRQLRVRHVVRGYWARRHFRDGVTRQVWVRPHVKGSDDLPFKAPTLRAWEFRR